MSGKRRNSHLIYNTTFSPKSQGDFSDMTPDFTKLSTYYYNLPEELIAQTPLAQRDGSKMLILNKEKDGFSPIKHDFFYNICQYLKKGDVLVLNNSKVLPARLIGFRVDDNFENVNVSEELSPVEFLLLENLGNDNWEIICKPGKKVKPGRKFSFGEGLLTAEVLEILENGNRIVKFYYEGVFYQVLDKIGQMPLPPYIHEKLKDNSRYQTVYAEKLGSAAAPTAGLHFTQTEFEKLREMGIEVAFVTLHVGLGTFRPVKSDDIREHTMHSEWYEIPQETIDIIEKTRKFNAKIDNSDDLNFQKRRIFAVGTTSMRTLESYAKTGKPSAKTDIFIYPPYDFQIVDGLITNFHLPESTLIMLVSAFGGYNNVMNAYKIAVEEKYRFFSFGDCMLIH
jgi:S-adenosylmethionine:tRNA ribosyltransferase-isomerase